MDTATAPSSASEALDMVRAGLEFLAAADATAMAAEEQAWCLRGLEQAHSVATVARTSVLGAFSSGQGYAADADYSPRAWLIHKTGVTKGAAVAYTAWVRRAEAHPQVAQALATGEMSESYARTLCGWTDRLPEKCRAAADEVLVTAAAAGMDLPGLAGLFAEIYERSRSDEPDEDPGHAFEDRSVRLETTFGGAGVLTGDLTPECAAVVGAVLDALSAPAGAEDTRTRAQRCHDALAEAMRRLVAANLVPERAGQPVKVLAHINLSDLMRLDGNSTLQQEWTERVRTAWAAHRATASVTGGDGGAWLEGDAAAAFACDAAITPVITGDVNYPVLEDLVQLCAELARLTDVEAAGQEGDRTDPGSPPCASARRWNSRSSARQWISFRDRAGWRASCAAAS